MGLLKWLAGKRTKGNGGLREWRRAWDAAARAPDAAEVARLEARLDALALPEDDIEIEREMLWRASTSWPSLEPVSRQADCR